MISFFKKRKVDSKYKKPQKKVSLLKDLILAVSVKSPRKENHPLLEEIIAKKLRNEKLENAISVKDIEKDFPLFAFFIKSEVVDNCSQRIFKKEVKDQVFECAKTKNSIVYITTESTGDVVGSLSYLKNNGSKTKIYEIEDMCEQEITLYWEYKTKEFKKYPVTIDLKIGNVDIVEKDKENGQ